MKKFLLFSLFVVAITSCNSISPDSNPMQLPWLDSVTVAEDPGIVIYPPFLGSPIGTGYICFIKFKKDEYKKYIIAKPDIEDGYYSFYWLQGVNAEKLVGSSPFIDLPNGYVAVDWKWWPGIINEPYTLLMNIPWKSFKRYNQKWTYNDVLQPEVHELIDEVWHVGYPHLDWYSGNYRIPINPTTNMPANVCSYVRECTFFVTYNDLDAQGRAYYKQAVKEEDKRFKSYLQVVKKLIESGEYTKECQLWKD